MYVYSTYDPIIISPTLLINVCAKLTRNIKAQAEITDPRPPPPHLPHRPRSAIHNETLTHEPDRIKHVKHAIPQPHKRRRLRPAQDGDEVRIAHDLRDAPRKQHRRVRRTNRHGRELLDVAPEHGAAGEDLKRRRRDGGAHDAWNSQSASQ